MSTTRFLATLTLVAGLALVASAKPGVPKPIPAVVDIIKLADSLDRQDVADRAKKIVKEHDSCDISAIFTSRGAGIGTAVKAGHKNRIDQLVHNWAGAKPPSRAELLAHRNDLLRVARVLQAMAELAPFRTPPSSPAVKDKDALAKEWAKVAADFKIVARDLHTAIADADAAATRKITLRLQETCRNCHLLAGI